MGHTIIIQPKYDPAQKQVLIWQNIFVFRDQKKNSLILPSHSTNTNVLNIIDIYATKLISNNTATPFPVEEEGLKTNLQKWLK